MEERALQPPVWAEGWGDRQDGTYNNPVLPADYSDPDVVRVGRDYYLVVSTFQLSPGLTVLHSQDLVNWTIIGSAARDLTQISPRFGWHKMDGYARGIWAPCITYNRCSATFYIHFGTPDEGYFVVTAKDPAGPWSDIAEVKKPGGIGFGAGWDDCGVLWDDDGTGYFIGTNFANNYQSYLYQMAEDGCTLLDGGVPVHCTQDGYGPDEYLPEANKLLKIGGSYYFYHNGCNLVDGKYVRKAWIMRARHIYGTHSDGTAGSRENPGQYQHIPFPMVEGWREPCQGNLIDVETPQGVKWYFFTHHGTLGVEGRPCSLLLVVWEDGWPVVADAHSRRQMIWQGLPKPLPEGLRQLPQSGGSFEGAQLEPQWMWNYQPRVEKWSLTERPGWLRLHAFVPLAPSAIDKAGNTLLQRMYRTKSNTVTVKLDCKGMAEGQNAGLLHMAGRQYTAIGLLKGPDGLRLTYATAEGRTEGLRVQLAEGVVWLRSQWGYDCVNRFFYSLDGEHFEPFGQEYSLKGADYRGDYVGIFNFNDLSESGYIDVGAFCYNMQ